MIKVKNQIKNTKVQKKKVEIDLKQLELISDVKTRKLLMLLSAQKLPNSNNSFSSSTVLRSLEQPLAEMDRKSSLKIHLPFSKKITDEETVFVENIFSNQRTYYLL